MLDRARARREALARRDLTAFFTCLLIALLVAGGLMYNRLVLPPARSRGDDQTQAAAAKDPAKTLPTEDPSDWEILVDPTPTPVRHAIPIAPESRR